MENLSLTPEQQTENIISIARLTNNQHEDNILLQVLNNGVVWVERFREFNPEPLYPNHHNLYLSYGGVWGDRKQITNNDLGNDSQGFSLDGNNVAWYSSDGNDREIYLYNSFNTLQLTHNSEEDIDPLIENELVVWLGFDGNDLEVFLYNGNSTIQLTNNDIDDSNILISDGNLVWQNETGLYFYDVDDEEFTLLTNEINNNYQIDGNNVAWSNADGVYLYNGVRTILLSDESGSDLNLVGNRVAWTEFDGNDLEVFLYDNNSSTTTQLTNNSKDDSEIQLSEDLVTWIFARDLEEFSRDLVIYDGQEISTLNEPGDFIEGYQIYDDRIFWMSYGNGIQFYDGDKIIDLSYGSPETHYDFEFNGNYAVWSELTSSAYSTTFYDGREFREFGYTRFKLSGNHILTIKEEIIPDTSFLDNGNSVVNFDAEFDYDGNLILEEEELAVDNNSNLRVYAEGDYDDSEIYIDDGNNIIQLTDNDVYDGNPLIYKNLIYWQRENTNNYQYEIYRATLPANLTELDSIPIVEASPSIAIGNVSLIERKDRSIDFVFPVTLTEASSETITLEYTTIDDSAIAGIDYTSVSGSLEFLPGETAKTIRVQVNSDLETEDAETFQVKLSNPINAALAIDTGIGTISDSSENETISLNINDLSLTEGDAEDNRYQLNVTLNRASTETITVDYATENTTAIAEADYTPVSGSLTFAPGETTKAITLEITDDSQSEVAETFRVILNNPTQAIISDRKGIVNIEDNDSVQPPSINILRDVRIEEIDEGNTEAIFTITLDRISSETITVDFVTEDDTATAGEDYSAVAGTLTFNPGESQKTISVEIKGDSLNENNETFNLSLSNASEASLQNSSGTGTIEDDDNPNPQGQTVELFRFRNTSFDTGTYIFVGAEERDAILGNPDFNQTFELEGVQNNGFINAAFVASTEPGDDLIPFYRLRSLQTPGTYLFVSTEEYDAIFAEDSEQQDNWVREGLDANEVDEPEFYLYDSTANLGTDFNRFQNTQNNTFLYAGSEETAAIEANPDLSNLFTNQGGAFESLV